MFSAPFRFRLVVLCTPSILICSILLALLQKMVRITNAIKLLVTISKYCGTFIILSTYLKDVYNFFYIVFIEVTVNFGIERFPHKCMCSALCIVHSIIVFKPILKPNTTFCGHIKINSLVWLTKTTYIRTP